MAITKINKLPDNVVTTAKIADNTVVNADVNACAAIAQSKLNNVCSTLTTLTNEMDNNNFNIGLLGFKMAVNESLTVFNLVDGVVDEFNDESGTDESEGSNDTYCGTNDYYTNSVTVCASFSAGFTTTSITEPDTSTAGTNPTQGSGTPGTFTVPDCMTSASIKVWGAGGSGGFGPLAPSQTQKGGGGGFATGTLGVSPGQSLYILAGEGGAQKYGGFGGVHPNSPSPAGTGRGGGTSGDLNGGGGGVAGITTAALTNSAPIAVLIAGSGGGGGADNAEPGSTEFGGAGGGLTGCAGGSQSEQTSARDTNQGGGGGQSSGGQGGPGPQATGQSGGLFYGGDSNTTGGGAGAGYYGGGGGGFLGPQHGGAGGGSSYIGHPQITSGSTEEGASCGGGGTGQPGYIADTNEGGNDNGVSGDDGYVLITGCGTATNVSSTTIISTAFTSTSVATSARIVVFEENVDTPTLNTDIIASVSRDGSTFTNATLSDSGYVTGSSGQRILTGQADISGQPSGQSMRWKLALANNQVKIHGVSLSWS